jgi:hypothetical protein
MEKLLSSKQKSWVRFPVSVKKRKNNVKIRCDEKGKHIELRNRKAIAYMGSIPITLIKMDGSQTGKAMIFGVNTNNIK